MRIIIIFSVILLTTTISFAATVIVPADYPTIQAGIHAVSSNDTVLVEPGTYTGEGNRDIGFGGKNIVLKSIAGAEQTIIDVAAEVDNYHGGFRIEGDEDTSAVIEGFTIMNGYNSELGSGIAVFNASLTIRNCIFKNNSATHGGALSCLPDSLSSYHVNVYDCVFENNSADGYGGAFYAYQSGVFVKIESCLFYDNSASAGGAVAFIHKSRGKLLDCTIVSNYADLAGSGVYTFSSIESLDIENTIIAFNENAPAFNLHTSVPDGFSMSCTDVYGNEGGDYENAMLALLGINGNINADPYFCDTAADIYSLSKYSPCLPSAECQETMGAYEDDCGICGDANDDQIVDVSDAVYIINYAFGGGPAPVYLESGDINCDNSVDVSDAVYIINYAFAGGNYPCDTDGDSEPDC